MRRFLKRRRFRSRDITTLPLPGGNQSGEQWVRVRYPAELRAIRGRQRSCLIVVTDADAGSTEARRAQLEAECRQQQIPPREDADPVVVVVPRRNIETWLAYLDGTQVDEVTAYPRLPRERDCAAHANRLYAMCHEDQRLIEPVPPSLREACKEYGRLRRP
ncbi:MAG: hypothetical protein OXG35_30575 [Acidobacteria bacterium]|nr:hypothetical protein [Acidobacteriota bacterium]